MWVPRTGSLINRATPSSFLAVLSTLLADSGAHISDTKLCMLDANEPVQMKYTDWYSVADADIDDQNVHGWLCYVHKKVLSISRYKYFKKLEEA